MTRVYIDKTVKHHFGDATIKSFVLQIAYGAFTIAKNLYITQCGGRAIKTILQIAYGASIIDKTLNTTQRRRFRNKNIF